MHEQTDRNPANTNQYAKWRDHHIVPHSTNPPTQTSRKGTPSTHIYRPEKTLISIRTLFDNNCIAVLDEKRVTFYDKLTRQIVMQGHRDPNTTLYMINMAAPLREMKEQHIPDTLRVHR